MYLFQIRRYLYHKPDIRGKALLRPSYTPWRTIERLHKLPDLSADMNFPSGLVEFRIQYANRTIWRSDHRQDHKYQHVSEHEKEILPLFPLNAS